MKKLLFTISMMFIMMSIVFAQEGALKAGLSVLYNAETEVTGIGGGVTLEYKVGNKFSVATVLDYVGGEQTASATLVTGENINIPYESPTISFRPEFRYYPKEVMKGFFAGLGLNLASSKYGEIVNGSSPNQPFIVSRSNEFLFHPTVLLGLNLPIKSNCSVELSGGLGILPEDVGYYIVPISLRIGYQF